MIVCLAGMAISSKSAQLHARSWRGTIRESLAHESAGYTCGSGFIIAGVHGCLCICMLHSSEGPQPVT